jgi:hypothetical protein
VAERARVKKAVARPARRALYRGFLIVKSVGRGVTI